MEKKIDGEKAVILLAQLYADQYGLTITRRGSNEEVSNNATNSGNSI